jgi:hypothetical protein
MIDIDLLYVKYRQQELWQEAAAQALRAAVQPARPRWRARVLGALTTLFSGVPWPASRRLQARPVPAVVRLSSPRHEGRKRW